MPSSTVTSRGPSKDIVVPVAGAAGLFPTSRTASKASSPAEDHVASTEKASTQSDVKKDSHASSSSVMQAIGKLPSSTPEDVCEQREEQRTSIDFSKDRNSANSVNSGTSCSGRETVQVDPAMLQRSIVQEYSVGSEMFEDCNSDDEKILVAQRGSEVESEASRITSFSRRDSELDEGW